MRFSTSKEKLSQMHEALDKQLQMANIGRPKSKRDRSDLRYISDLDENKKSTLSYNNINKPFVYQHDIKEIDIKTKKNEINELERKLLELEKKMDNISVSSEEDSREIQKEKRKTHLSQKNQGKRQDDARYESKDKENYNQNRYEAIDYPSFPDQQEQDQNSEDYFEVQKAIEKKKLQMKNARKKPQKQYLKISTQQLKRPHQLRGPIDHTHKNQQVDLKPRFSEKSEKPKSKISAEKKSIKSSVASKESLSKNLKKNHSRASLNSNGKNRASVKKQNSLQRSFQRSEKSFKKDELQIAQQSKKVVNMQKQLIHYKRLAQKYKNQVQQYKVMEIQFRQLKKNFSKSQQIRTQQKKIIESLKDKVKLK